MNEGTKYIVNANRVSKVFDTLDEAVEHFDKYHKGSIYKLITSKVMSKGKR